MSALLKKIENRIRNFSDQKFEIGGLQGLTFLTNLIFIRNLVRRVDLRNF